MSELNKVLIIDDDILTSSLVSEILTSAGYSCDICHNINQFKKCIKTQQYDIFIVDLLLEGLDGLEIIKNLRKEFPRTVILTITGLNASEHFLEAMKAGADHFFNKPINAEKLIEKLRELESHLAGKEDNFNFNEVIRTAFNITSNPVFITDNKGDLYYANKYFLEISGLSEERITRFNLHSLRFENAIELSQLINQRNYKHLDTRVLESRFLLEKSHEVWFNVIIIPVNIDPVTGKYYLIFQLFDITRKKQMDNFILSNEEKFRSFISLSNDGMALINEDGLVIEWNYSMTRITGVNIEKVYGEKFWDILQWVKIEFDNETLDKRLKANLKYALKRGMRDDPRKENVCRIFHKDGHVVFIQYSSFTIKVDNGYRLGIVVRDNTATILSQRKIAAQNEELNQAYIKMEKLARIDPLTQIANRRDIEYRLDYEKGRVTRYHHPLAIAIGDIDDFKHFNDTYGHDMGDFVLIEIARLLNKTIREQDMIGRWGGEEFIFVFPDTDIEGGTIICNRIREEIELHKFEFKGKSVKVTITIGLAEYRGNEEMDEVIKRADVSLYKGKKNGKNRVVAS
ncbi:MAG: diguanylate cyclase [Candidatus Cloacimonetes bacterium]|nr:diguanylate cyclase [Candidatus Cloacimonadota bacterium]